MGTIELDNGGELNFNNTLEWDKLATHSDRRLGVLELIASGDKCGKDLFIEQYMCEWKSDPRTDELYDRLSNYYKSTPDSVGNKTAMLLWMELKAWASMSGYTNTEINRAKHHVSMEYDR